MSRGLAPSPRRLCNGEKELNDVPIFASATRMRYHPRMSEPMVVLCPGQGAQAVGMGRAWYDASPEAKAVFQRADTLLGDRLGPALSDLCFHGPSERLNRTDISQPAIFVTSVACWRALLARMGLTEAEAPLAATAGLSLGEYTALHLAGVMSFEEALELVALRGRAMQDAAEAPTATSGGGGGMVALVSSRKSWRNFFKPEERDRQWLLIVSYSCWRVASAITATIITCGVAVGRKNSS